MIAAAHLGRIVVVVPTRNRADLAAGTVRSVLEQSTGTPLTVMVSDNSTDGDHVDTLRAAVDDLHAAHPRTDLQQVQPEQPLPMGPHWEWARRRATSVPGATHLLYLTDRTLLKPDSLEVLTDLAGRHPDQVISFNNEQVDDDHDPVRLARESWSGEIVSLPTHRLLELSAELIVARPLPRALNSLVPVKVLGEIATAYGDVFDSTAPDFCFCFRFLETADRMIYVDRPLTVMHGLARSNGRSTTSGVASPDTVDFMAAAAAAGIASHAPLPAVTTTYNVIASEYQRDPGGGRPPLNRRAYVNSLARETDGFVAGPMREANTAVLTAEGVGFGRLARLRRQVALVAHYLRVLGPVDFAVLTWDRLRGPESPTYSTKAEALAAARRDGPRRASTRHLRYLRGTRLGRVPLDGATAVEH